jgi:hypothetical protein
MKNAQENCVPDAIHKPVEQEKKTLFLTYGKISDISV